MKLRPQISLAFDGQCEAAFQCYAACLEGTITFMLKWGDSPMAGEVPPEWGVKVAHATLQIGDVGITGSDVPPERYERPKGFQIVLHTDEPAAAERAFEALSEHGAIELPLQETFWATRFGVLVDRFGVPWSINCEKAQAPPA